MTKNLKYQLLVGAILSCFLLGFSCGKSVEPVEPTDYPFYISATNPNQIFTFHPQTKKLDSTAVPWNAAITASADGKLLYVALGSSVLVVDAKTFTEIAEIPYPHQAIAVSPDNKYLALTGYDLIILRTSDYSLIFSDSAGLLYGSVSFSVDSRTFYCAVRTDVNSSHVVLKVELNDSTFQKSWYSFTGGSVVQVLPSIDETKLFLYSAVGLWTYAFEVYDVLQDSIIFRDILVPGGGEMALTPNGKFVFYTSPGRSGTDPPPDYSFKIFDVAANQIDTVVADSTFFYFGVIPGAPKRLAVTPDSRWLGIIGGQLSLFTFYLYDIRNKELIYRKEIDSSLNNFNTFLNITVKEMK